MPVAVFYVSGHGFGHAVRTAEVVRRLLRLAPEWTVHVCTTAPGHLFAGITDDGLPVRPVRIDPGIVESRDALSIDVPATVAALESFERHHPALIETETEYIRAVQADVIVADIPYVAGEIGDRAGVPVLGISNFTWDFIYEPFLVGHDRGHALLESMRAGYGRMQALLRLPFHHEMHVGCPVTDVGLVVAAGKRDRTAVFRQLGIGEENRRECVYVGWRGIVPIDALRRAAESSQEHLFLYLSDDRAALPENTRRVQLGPDLSFADVVSVSDVVISKLGYGMLSACVAAGCDLLYPPRTGFCEDAALREGAGRFLRSRELPVEDFVCGRWRTHLEQIRCQPRPDGRLPVDGADECARMIIAAPAPR